MYTLSFSHALMNARPLNIFRVGGLSAAEAGKYLALYAFHLGQQAGMATALAAACLCL